MQGYYGPPQGPPMQNYYGQPQPVSLAQLQELSTVADSWRVTLAGVRTAADDGAGQALQPGSRRG